MADFEDHLAALIMEIIYIIFICTGSTPICIFIL